MRLTKKLMDGIVCALSGSEEQDKFKSTLKITKNYTYTHGILSYSASHSQTHGILPSHLLKG